MNLRIADLPSSIPRSQQSGTTGQDAAEQRMESDAFADKIIVLMSTRDLLDSTLRLLMAGKQAKVLSINAYEDFMLFVETTRQPERNRVITLLAFKAGLRAGEIAKLTWQMVETAEGAISTSIELWDLAAKRRHGRRIPIQRELAEALIKLRRQVQGDGPVIRSERGGALTPLSVVVWFNRAFSAVGLEGCSSHSGRRTFITRAARLVHQAGGSLRDVQLLAGHRSIQTTQHYIDGDSDAQRALISLI